MVPEQHPADRLEDQRHTAAYPFGAVCPERDTAFGPALPVVGADPEQTFLDQLSSPRLSRPV